MALGIRATNTGSVSGGTSITVTKPSGTTSGDYLLGLISKDDDDAPVFTGFTDLAGAGGGSTTSEGRASSKVAGGSEGASYTISWAGGEDGVAMVLAIQDTTGIDITAEDVAITNRTSGSVSGTVTNNGSLAILYGACEDAGTNFSAPDGTWTQIGSTLTQGSGVTGASMAVWYKTLNAGATGTLTVGSDANQELIVGLIVYAPAASGNTLSGAMNTDDYAMAGVAKVAVAMSGAMTLDEYTMSGAAKVAVAASMAATLDDYTMAGSMSAKSVMTGAMTLDDDTMAGSAAVLVSSSAAMTLDDDTLSGAAQVAVNATASMTLDEDTMAGSAAVAIAASAAMTLDDDTMAGSANVGAAEATLSGAMTLDDTTLAGSAQVAVAMSGAMVLDDDTMAGSAAVAIDAAASMSLDDDTMAGSMTAGSVDATLSGAMALDDASMDGIITIPAISDSTLSGPNPGNLIPTHHRGRWPKRYIYRDHVFIARNASEERALLDQIQADIESDRTVPVKPKERRKLRKQAKHIIKLAEIPDNDNAPLPYETFVAAAPVMSIKPTDLTALTEDDEAMILMMMVA